MASASAAVAQRNQDATVYVGGLDEKVDEEMLWELFVQVRALLSDGLPIRKMYIAQFCITGRPCD